MSHKKFHINPETSEAAPCRAIIRECKYGDNNHFDTLKKAQEEAEIRNLKQYNFVTTLTKNIKYNIDKEYIMKIASTAIEDDMYIKAHIDDIVKPINIYKYEYGPGGGNTLKAESFEILDKKAFVQRMFQNSPIDVSYINDEKIEKLEKVGFFNVENFRKYRDRWVIIGNDNNMGRAIVILLGIEEKGNKK